jgi:polyisoprenoid-binding protein YceI
MPATLKECESMRIVILSLALFSLTAMTACGVFQEPEAPSAPLEAIPLQLESPELPARDAGPAAQDPAAQEPAADEPEADAPAGDEPLAEEAGGEQQGEAGDAGPEGELRFYRIDPARSEVRFQLSEDLRGQRTTVIGVTNQVAGELALNLADLSTARVGIVQINARGLATDNSFRNRAIANEILESGRFELITFEPAGLDGLPASAAVGQEVAFTIRGDLTIRDISQPVTFAVTAVALSETEIGGTATATVTRQAFDLRIPSVPNVANVDEEVLLTIDFVAGPG